MTRRARSGCAAQRVSPRVLELFGRGGNLRLRVLNRGPSESHNASLTPWREEDFSQMPPRPKTSPSSGRPTPGLPSKVVEASPSAVCATRPLCGPRPGPQCLPLSAGPQQGSETVGRQRAVLTTAAKVPRDQGRGRGATGSDGGCSCRVEPEPEQRRPHA